MIAGATHSFGRGTGFPANYGAERDRTAGLLNAIQALSQLSYSPSIQECPRQDSNLYAISGTGPSNQPVYQFQHVGVKIFSGQARPGWARQDSNL